MYHISDLDFLVLNDLTHYKDFLLEEEVPFFYPFPLDWVVYLLRLKKPESILTNCAFSFGKNHPLTKLILDHVKEAYEPNEFTSIGPGSKNIIRFLKETFWR